MVFSVFYLHGPLLRLHCLVYYILRIRQGTYSVMQADAGSTIGMAWYLLATVSGVV